MANKRRGEVTFDADGETYKMRMTLNAMAEIEDAFELDSITQLADIFTEGEFKVKQLIQLLGALIRGGGHEITDREVGDFDLDAVEAFGKAMDAINAQGGEEKKSPVKKTAKKKSPSRSTGEV